MGTEAGQERILPVRYGALKSMESVPVGLKRPATAKDRSSVSQDGPAEPGGKSFCSCGGHDEPVPTLPVSLVLLGTAGWAQVHRAHRNGRPTYARLRISCPGRGAALSISSPRYRLPEGNGGCEPFPHPGRTCLRSGSGRHQGRHRPDVLCPQGAAGLEAGHASRFRLPHGRRGNRQHAGAAPHRRDRPALSMGARHGAVIQTRVRGRSKVGPRIVLPHHPREARPCAQTRS